MTKLFFGLFLLGSFSTYANDCIVNADRASRPFYSKLHSILTSKGYYIVEHSGKILVDVEFPDCVPANFHQSVPLISA